MKKKKWQRSTGIKGLLLILQYLLLGTGIFLGLFLLTLCTHGLRLSDSGKDYLDSKAFANTFYDATYDVTHAISCTFPYTDSLKEDIPGTVIDLNEIATDEKISFHNTSGLAYSLSDLEKWAKDFDTSSGNPIVICHLASSDATDSLFWCYYYVDDFLKRIDNGEFTFSVNPDYYGYDSEVFSTDEASTEETGTNQIISQIREDLHYGVADDLSGIQIEASDGKVLFDSISLYQGYYEPTEAYSPQGADSVLAVLNSDSRWNSRIEEAFESLYNLLCQVEFYTQQKQVLESYSQGHSNMSYVYINEETGQVLSNDSKLADRLENDSISKDTVSNRLSGKSPYILIQSGSDDFTSNLNGLDNQNTFPGNDITYSSWKESVGSMLSGINGNFVFAACVDQTFPVSDTFSTGKTFFDSYSRYPQPVFFLFLLCILLFLASFVWLTTVAGRKSTDEELHLCFFDCWPTELAAGFVLFSCFSVASLFLRCLSFADYQIAKLQASLVDASLLFTLLLLGLHTLFWFQIGYLSLVRRIKAKQLWKNSCLRWLLRLLVKITRKTSHKLHSLADFYSRNTAARLKVTFAFLGFVFFKYVIFGLFLGNIQLFFLFSFYADLLLLFFCITKAYHREQIIKGLKEISDGNLQYKISLERLSGDDKRMAEYINNIGSGLDAAVENSVKNERMKTELITNVSHDLKTPLTSIISYIDLLKRENFTDPKVLEYLDILEAKASRLKILTEDVVEASKASTGNLTLNMTNIDFAEMLHQVIGEFEECLEAHHLTMMVQFPDEPSIIYADGQRLWRVLENIFGNVTKYAMEDTRVYAEVRNSRDHVIFTLKNISSQPLNFAAEELTERFVRGDVARNTEGIGLGLSIAKSLTELQGGKFQLYLDGDLFKVTITFQAQSTRKADGKVPAQPEPEVR